MDFLLVIKKLLEISLGKLEPMLKKIKKMDSNLISKGLSLAKPKCNIWVSG